MSRQRDNSGKQYTGVVSFLVAAAGMLSCVK